MEKLVFCGGLPRTGSTVLMNILQQNPKIFTTSTCPLTNIIRENILLDTKREITFKAMESEKADAALYGFIHGATKGWYEGLTNKPIIISKNRTWAEIYHLYPKTKFICMVRDLRDIVDSFERMNSKVHSLHSINVTNNRLLPAMSNREKYDYFFNSPNSLTGGLSHLKKMLEIHSVDRTSIMFVQYEMLMENPNLMLNKLYAFLGEQPYNHDLNNVPQSEIYEHDNIYQQEYTNHKTKQKLERGYEFNSKRYLCDDFYSLILKEYKWYYDAFYSGVMNAK